MFLKSCHFSMYFIQLITSHLSYFILWCPVDSNHFSWICSIGWTRTTDSRFYQLNYYRVWFTVYSVFSPVHIPYLPEHQVFMSGWQDSNLRPRGPKPCVLPTELHPDNIKEHKHYIKNRAKLFFVEAEGLEPPTPYGSGSTWNEIPAAVNLHTL